ncbi:hypothetical protein [Acinetobacter baumannii]
MTNPRGSLSSHLIGGVETVGGGGTGLGLLIAYSPYMFLCLCW